MAKFKVGDTVRVRKNLLDGKIYGNKSFIGSMNNLKGKIVHIKKVELNGEYRLLESDHWWTDEMLEPVYKNFNYIQFTNITPKDSPVEAVDCAIYHLINKNKSLFDKVEFSYRITEKKPILDDAEKKYLSNVIKPFRDKVESIVKFKFSADEHIAIRIKHDLAISLPKFKIGSMYKGMQAGKTYTLEELGLQGGL